MPKYLVRFLKWRIKNISDKNFILFLASVIGALSGLAAVILKESVHLIQQFLTKGFNVRGEQYLYLTYPLIGILLTVIISKYLVKEKPGHGITSILYDISKRAGNIKAVRTFSRMITSAVTVGFGGSVGLEAPIVVTGSAIGSNVGQLVHMNSKNRTLLIGCGSAAAIAGIFNSPVAGVIFAIEVILTEVTVAKFIPLLISAVVGSLVSIMLIGEDVLFSFKQTEPFLASDVPAYVLLGITTGLVSVYFTRLNYRVERLLEKFRNDFKKAIFGGLALGLIIFLFPPIYGEGYDVIRILLGMKEGHVLENSLFFSETNNLAFIVLFLFGVILIKPAASAFTIGAGGSGGIFAPSLFIGAATGFVFAASGNAFLGINLSEPNFVLVGMCGAMSGILHAPLTAIFLIAEITSGYTLFIPLMLVSAISYNAATYFERYSIYTKYLIETGDLIQHDKDRQVLSLMSMRKLIETDLHKVKPDDTLGHVVELVRKSRRNIFPVVNEENRLVGVLTLDDIREVMFDLKAHDEVLVNSIMHTPPAVISPHENMQSVMHKFEVTGAWNLPVLDNFKYVGFLSKSSIFNSYRNKLIHAQKG